MAPKKPKTPKTPATASTSSPVQIPEMPIPTAEEARAAAYMALGQAPGRMEASQTRPNLETKTGRRQFVTSAEWEDYVAKQYPGMLEIYRNNPEIAEIIRQGYIQDQPAADIVANVQASKWYLALGPGEYDYITKVAIGDKAYLDSIANREELVRKTARTKGYELPEESVKQIAADSLKGAWDSAKIGQIVGEQLVKTAPEKAGQPSKPEAAPTALQAGADAAALRARARRYGLNLTDSQVEGYVQSVLSGSMSDQQVTDSFRNQAKSLYPSIAAQLDAGDLESGVQAYKSEAARILGIDPTQVDFTNDKYKALLTYRDPDSKENRLMNTTEWGNYLRTLPEWKKTSEAKTRYQTMIDTIDKVFGKVR